MNFNGSQELAKRLINKNGIRVALKRDGTDIAKGTGIFATRKKDAAQLTQSTNRLLLVAGLKLDPQVGDIIVVDKREHTVMAMEVVRPTNITILWKIEVTQ